MTIRWCQLYDTKFFYRKCSLSCNLVFDVSFAISSLLQRFPEDGTCRISSFRLSCLRWFSWDHVRFDIKCADEKVAAHRYYSLVIKTIMFHNVALPYIAGCVSDYILTVRYFKMVSLAISTEEKQNHHLLICVLPVMKTISTNTLLPYPASRFPSLDVRYFQVGTYSTYLFEFTRKQKSN